jgi:hypothetical protein
VEAAEADRCRDAELAGKSGSRAACRQNGFLGLFQGAFCPDVETLPSLCRRQAARRSQQKTDAEPVLELGDGLGDSRLPNLHLAGGTGERPGVDDADKNLHGKVPIHAIYSLPE